MKPGVLRMPTAVHTELCLTNAGLTQVNLPGYLYPFVPAVVVPAVQ